LPQFAISNIDIAIVVIYILGTRLIIGWYAAVKTRNADTESYFLAGRNMTWPIIGLSFYVANMSGSTFIALPASGYYSGISVYHYEWLPAAILVFFAIFILPHYLHSRIFTVPQFLEQRFSRRVRTGFTLFLLIANIFIDAAAALYAGSIILQTLFPQISIWITVSFIALLAGVYTFFGGLRAVVMNDVIQAVMILTGGSIIAYLAFQEIPSWSAASSMIAPEKLSLFRPVNDPVMPWPGIFSGVLVIGIYFWCMNQFIIQRALAAKSLNHARWGALFAGALKLPNLFLLILPGVIATQLYPDLERPDMVFPILAFDLLPVGWRGVMLAALTAAILSSLEAILNSAATLLTMDIVKPARPRLSEHALVKIGKTATLAFMVIAALWAPQINRFPTLWQYLQSILSYVTPPVVAIFLLGLFWKRGNATGAEYTLILGSATGIIGWIMNEILHITGLQYLYAGGLMFLLSCAIFFTASLLSPAPSPAKVRHTVWQCRHWKNDSEALTGTSIFTNYRYLSIGLLVITAVILIIWR
jgi:SSS family solute:Na+ symporter